MSEISPTSFSETNPTPETISEEGVLSVFERWKDEPRGGDQGQAACAESTLAIYQNNPLLRQSFGFMVDIQSDAEFGPGINITNEYLANLWYRAAQYTRMLMNNKTLMKKLGSLNKIGNVPQAEYRFPEDHYMPEAWNETFRNISDNPHLLDQFEYSTGRRIIQTNYYERYLGVFLAIATDSDKPQEPIIWADFGTSIGLGPRGLTRGEPPNPFTVYQPIDGHMIDSRALPLEVDSRSTAAYSDLIKAKLPIGAAIGFDVMGVNDPSQKLWVKASHYWKELNNNSQMRRFDRLAGLRDSRVSFHSADVTVPGSVEEIMNSKLMPKADYVSMLTMRHQLKSKDEYDQAIKNAISILKPGGKIIESDFIHPSIWTDWSYVTTVRFPFSDNPEPKVHYIWRNARCSEVIAAPMDD